MLVEITKVPNAENSAIHLHPTDNVAIARVPLPAGAELRINGLPLTTLDAIPAELEAHHLTLVNGGHELIYTYDTQGPRTGITGLITDLAQAGIRFKDLDTTQSSLEDIFVDLVRQQK